MALTETVKTMLAVEFGEPERAKANWVRPQPNSTSRRRAPKTLDLN
jgi:hypothetical protein